MTGSDSARREAAEAFGLTADPSAYVPRLALEAVLAELVEGIGKTPSCAALTGEAGLGKTLVLHVLQQRLAGSFEALYVPFPRLSPSELWCWLAVALGLGSGEDDRGAVLGRAYRLARDGSGLVLLVDDAGALPPATRAELVAACAHTGFSLVLAFDVGDEAQLEALPNDVRRIDLGPPMTLAETRAYVHTRLRRVDPDGAISAQLGAARLAEIHDASGGVPARLHALLDAWLRGPERGERAVEPAAREVRREAAARAAPARPREEAPALALPPALRQLLTRLEEPRTQLLLAVLFVLGIAGLWVFVLERNSGVASVGVPVQRFEPPRREAVPEPAPPAAEPAPVVAPAPPESEASAAEPATPAADAMTVAPPAPVEPAPAAAAEVQPPARRADSEPPVAASRPAASPARAETPVEIASARFPEEHVPPSLEVAPLAPPPPGPRISINAVPWAEIELDGVPVGETPLGELAVAPGVHRVRARLPDGRVVEREVEARSGDVYLVVR